MLQSHQPRDRQLQCPINPAHILSQFRMQTHIDKCLRSHPNVKKVRCPFDRTHVIDPMTYEHHINNCESSGTVLNSMYVVEVEKTLGTVPVEQACATEPLYMDEDWNGNHPTYTPMQATENKEVIRLIQCVPKTERKAFRNAERQRLAKMDKLNSGVFEPKEEKKEFEAPLRIPNARPKSMLTLNNSTSKNHSSNDLNNLSSQFTKSNTMSDQQLNVDKENIRDLRNRFEKNMSLGSNDEINFIKPSIPKKVSGTDIGKVANMSCPSVIETRIKRAVDDSMFQERDNHATEGNTTFTIGTYRTPLLLSSDDDSNSNSGKSLGNDDSASGSSPEKPRTFSLPRMSKVQVKPSVGRGVAILRTKERVMGENKRKLTEEFEKTKCSPDAHDGRYED